MALPDLAELDQFKTGGFPADYPANERTFYAPVDNLHGVLLALIKSATHSVIVSMFGFDDDEIADMLKEKLEHEHVFVQLTLDRSQSRGVHEKAILAREDYPASSIAIGNSEKGAIDHLKMIVVDGEYVIGGSTNLSSSGESKQDNELTVTRSRARAAEARTRIDVIHHHMLQAGRGAA
jgi:phosphatidylserine/phosphatidylglycerophosphate/cardiolipin synthase-like enzyme